ncbi:MAG: PilZ domain-containing protein [Planctomycetia bacterium]|nr:PilZ domain-containing protein [Planctomycetia bacterium]
MTLGTLALAQHLNSDRFAVRGAVTAIRNAFMQLDQLQLLTVDGSERRASARVRLHVPVNITAAVVELAQEQVQSADGPSISAVTRDISLGGLGLLHSAPMPSQRALVRFDLPGDGPIQLVIEVVWSNRTDDGTWASGARILGLAS